MALLGGVLARLRAEMEGDGKGAVFEALKDSLGGGDRSHREVAESLGMNEGAVRVAAHRLRRRYREPLRTQIAQYFLMLKPLSPGTHTIHYSGTFHFDAGELIDEPLDLLHEGTIVLDVVKQKNR